MDAPYSPLEFALLNNYQRDLPLVPAPFAAIAAKLVTDEQSILMALKRLHGKGAVSRVGAVFAPCRIGVSTLAAMAVPAERIEAVAALVSARREVNHNYEREHRYNLWFVATARDETGLANALDDIAAQAGLPVISLPLVEQFHIDLGFDLCDAAKRGPNAGSMERVALSAEEERLAAIIERGLLLSSRPYAEVAAAAGTTEAQTIEHLRHWLDIGVIRRLGVVVHHHELGYKANAMVVFDIPDAIVASVGARLSAVPGVTLCYQRRRHAPEWSYNVYCMVHGRTREEAAPVIAQLRGATDCASEVLFSTRRFKQRGARYFDVA